MAKPRIHGNIVIQNVNFINIINICFLKTKQGKTKRIFCYGEGININGEENIEASLTNDEIYK